MSEKEDQAQDPDTNKSEVIALPDTEPEDAVRETADAEAENAEAETAPSAPKKRKWRIPWGRLLLAVLLLITMAAVAYLGWRGYQFLALDQAKSAQIDALKSEQQRLESALSGLRQQHQQSERAAEKREQALNQRIQALEQRVIAQNKRLLSMSTTSREDWLLAEAQYLLKLANQRVLIERSAQGAESLLAEADAILRDLEDPDLFPLREAVNSDLAALRLTKKIDVEGIYLSINGLIVQLPKLPTQPTRQQVLAREENAQPAETEPAEASDNTAWWGRMLQSFRQFRGGLKEYINLREHATVAKPLLTPEAQLYLQQNIRLMLERAQLALLREKPAIYRESLQQAHDYIGEFYPESIESRQYREQLNALQTREILTQLPDISASLELLHAYIEQLHDLKGAQPKGDQ